MTDKPTKRSVSFKAQARTIDHLGKGQIADAPTAVSELWKNSYDAYARNVALHLFDGDIKCGAIIDNGCGMTYDQLINSWLTVGTASKTQKKLLPEQDRFGLEDRYTQGEKGIGRLSTAFLAPVTLIVTKKMNTRFSAVLIDWRLFENTYLGLNDIKVPMEEFDSLEQLPSICADLQKEMLLNLALNPESEEEKYLRRMWELFTVDEEEAFELRHNPNSKDIFISTEEKVKTLCNSFKFNPDFTDSWNPLLDKVEELDGATHGTSLYLLDLGRDLELLTNRGDMSRDSSEYQDVKTDLVDTLRAFVDPFNRNRAINNEFYYEIIAFDSHGYLLGEENVILKYEDVFGYEDFEVLEHRVEGSIDEKGWFRGKVTAFGKDYTDVVIPCRSPGMEAYTKTGSFDLKFGSFEFEISKSTHEVDEHSLLREQAEKYAGFMIFRDGLRVLPYGRTNNDFFGIDERRNKNAGRYYWATRRMFGQIELDQKKNKRLVDKAGREGFVKNQAARELKALVMNLLIQVADNYFGTKSEERKSVLAQLDKDKKRQSKARNTSARITKQAFNQALETNLPKLSIEVENARNVYMELEKGLEISLHHLDELVSQVNKLDSLRPDLKTPNKPASLSVYQEEQYRSYRDLFGELSELLQTCRERLNKIESLSQQRSPMESAQNKYDSSESAISKQVNRYAKAIDSTFERLQTTWKQEVRFDKDAYKNLALEILDAVTDSSDIEFVLNELDKVYRELSDDIASKYEGFLFALTKLEQGIDIESAFNLAEEERENAEREINQIRNLAQLGISFEILAHELSAQDKAVTRSLNSMSSSAKNEIGFKNAMRAHKQFTDYLRFLSPLKLSGYQVRDDITGYEIVKNISSFFTDQFERQNVHLKISDSFKNMKIVDVQSRIIPVFVNLINNALYWVGMAEEERVIKIDIINDLVVIANNGPAIDQDDVKNLFQLFYSRRPSGNGVGLYLSRQNLAVARHKIWYAENPEEMLIRNGANFVIQFRGMEVK
ncbi:ATP-binding protein [Vibrio vulnificus]|uniref:ATP-binding protein n=1 Tax=Vibrio vulnificus TaxID=672 RepID=UPI000698246D|nr:ATP-binding protein [Vibrio vulnificus]ELA3114354.1 ATP-binding protein [Vibrio vulnificus]ELA3118304.1 ATP-binding protein [Vibrio vulnificus]